jgi:hypothetical protein
MALLGRPVDGSDQAAADLEDWQFVLSEGPAVACYRSKRPVEFAGDGIFEQCPLLAEHLVDAGIGSLAAVPIACGNDVVGTISLYSAPPLRLQPPQWRTAATWAELVARSITSDTDLWAERRQRVTACFDLAIGCVVTDSNVDHRAAEAMIRAHAFSHDTPLRTICADIMSGALVLSAG